VIILLDWAYHLWDPKRRAWAPRYLIKWIAGFSSLHIFSVIARFKKFVKHEEQNNRRRKRQENFQVNEKYAVKTTDASYVFAKCSDVRRGALPTCLSLIL
jgi:hypothetical protein